MQKWLLIIIASVLLVAACGGKEEEKVDDVTDKQENIEVDKGLLNVEVTIPAALFEGTSEEEIVSNAKVEGFTDVTVNEDGSVTYKMSKKEHQQLLDELETEMETTIEEIEGSEDYPSIVDITQNKDLTQFDVTVNRQQYEDSFDGFAILTLAISGMYYGAFNGLTEDELKVKINLIDEGNDEVFHTSIYPDDLEESSADE